MPKSLCTFFYHTQMLFCGAKLHPPGLMDGTTSGGSASGQEEG